MANAQVNGIEIAYEIDGTGPPLLLIMGIGGQLTDWHPGLVEQLAESFTVIRFDNRDSGLSTQIDAPRPSWWQLAKGNLWRSSTQAPYSLDDMADDANGLLEALGIDSADVVGMSMGGMLAQLLALRHPDRVRSLNLIMTNTGNRRSGQPTPRVLLSLARRSRITRDQVIDATLKMFAMVGGADWDEAEQLRRSSLSLARAYNPAGVLRQSQAIAGAEDRTERLASVTQPTVIIHGLDDTLVRPSGGIALAKAMQHSRLILFPRMGHDLPATRHDDMVTAIRDNSARAMSD